MSLAVGERDASHIRSNLLGNSNTGHQYGTGKDGLPPLMESEHPGTTGVFEDL